MGQKEDTNLLELGWKEIVLGSSGKTKEVNTNFEVVLDSWENWFLLYKVHYKIKMKINGLSGLTWTSWNLIQ